MKLKRCFVRYEPNIGDGTMFLFNKENGKMLEGDYYSYIVIRSILDNVDLEILAEQIAYENERPIEEVQEEIDGIIQVLQKKDFLESYEKQ